MHKRLLFNIIYFFLMLAAIVFALVQLSKFVINSPLAWVNYWGH